MEADSKKEGERDRNRSGFCPDVEEEKRKSKKDRDRRKSGCTRKRRIYLISLQG